jgi:hypothetical protein
MHLPSGPEEYVLGTQNVFKLLLQECAMGAAYGSGNWKWQ